MNKSYTRHEVVTVQRYAATVIPLDHIMRMALTSLLECMSCGAEWEPISVRYSAEELGLWESPEEDDSEWNRYFE